MRKAVRADKASPGSGAYSQAVVAGDFVYVSGQGPLDLSGKVINGTIEEEVALTMDNVKNIIEAAGCTMDDVVKVNVYLADINDFDKFNTVYATYFNQPMPARTTVEAGLDGILVEIDAIAMLPKNEG